MGKHNEKRELWRRVNGHTMLVGLLFTHLSITIRHALSIVLKVHVVYTVLSKYSHN